MSSFGCCEYVCVCVASAFPCAPSTPLFAPVCRFCLRGCMFSKSVCEPGCDCVLVAAAVGGRGCKDIKKEKKTFFFFHLCAGTAVPASVPSAMGTKTTVTTHSFF